MINSHKKDGGIVRRQVKILLINKCLDPHYSNGEPLYFVLPNPSDAVGAENPAIAGLVWITSYLRSFVVTR
ncbi:MAG: hypothetical protein IPJ23_09715 [Ignavibacteriales bacterium]|nr:hypothetical protein [Ignavibacteriales bacterium]